MDQKPVHVFLDTNTLLHYKRPDHIDWPTLLGADAVNLVITPALIDELEAQKTYTNRSRKLKDRADAAIKWIARFVDEVDHQEIRLNVRLVFVRDSPTIDFAAYRLSHTVPDDQLIASALQFKEETGATVLFVSNDTGLRMKLPPRGLKGVSPRDDDRLPDVVDDSEKEVAELRRQLSRYEARIPKLDLTFRDGKTFTELKSPKRDNSRPEVPSTAFVGYDTKTQMERFTKYLSEYATWQTKLSLFFPCELMLKNNGSAEATDIVINFSLPDFIAARAADDIPKKPKPPRSIFDRPDFTELPAFPNLATPRPPGKPFIGRYDGSASFEIPSLVHNRVQMLHRFYFEFAEQAAIRNFSVSFVVTCAEIIDQISGKLHFTIPARRAD